MQRICIRGLKQVFLHGGGSWLVAGPWLLVLGLMPGGVAGDAALIGPRCCGRREAAVVGTGVVRRVVVLVGLLLVLSGCGAGPGDAAVAPPPGDRVHAGYAQYVDSVPIADGYMREIEGTLQYGGARVDVVRRILDDRVITAGEMNDLESKVVGCYAKYGFQPNRDYWFTKGSGIDIYNNVSMSVDDSRISDIENECEAANGYELVVSYYYQALYNPEDIDLDPYRFECYREHGLVDGSMSFDEFNRVRKAGGNPYVNGNPTGLKDSRFPVWDTCWTDPLHNIANSPLKDR